MDLLVRQFAHLGLQHHLLIKTAIGLELTALQYLPLKGLEVQVLVFAIIASQVPYMIQELLLNFKAMASH